MGKVHFLTCSKAEASRKSHPYSCLQSRLPHAAAGKRASRIVLSVRPGIHPYAGIAAVLDETFDERLLVYSMFHFAGHHHGGGSSHRDAVYYHFRTAAAHTGAVACGHRFIVPAEKLVGGCGPLQYVETVEPAICISHPRLRHDRAGRAEGCCTSVAGCTGSRC